MYYFLPLKKEMKSHDRSFRFYQVGGSLSNNAPSYVERQADIELYTALRQQEYCYVLNARQMGKTSLLVRVKQQLEQEGCLCSKLDLTSIGSSQIAPTQWHKAIALDLCLGFNLFAPSDFFTWWQAQDDLPLTQKFRLLIERVLLPQYAGKPLFVFIDEIDSVLGLDFSVDDFWALVRYCYDQRATDPRYRQLTFAIFGVASPTDLIADKRRTPFNIGRAIALQGFRLEEAMPLVRGWGSKAEDSQTLLQEILHWTGGQPFLTQKLCSMVAMELSAAQNSKLLIGKEGGWVENLVRAQIVRHWESQDEPEHLRTIRDRLLSNERWVGRVLGIYQQLCQGVTIPTDDSREQVELLLCGVAIAQTEGLQIKNPIYQEVFDLEWVNTQLSKLRPYSQMFNAWIASQQIDQSRLIRGEALQDARLWAQGKSLTNLDYQFLAASEQRDRLEKQQALEAERTREVEARLVQERKTARWQRYFLTAIGLALLVAVGLGLTALWQYRQALEGQQQAKLEQVQALSASANALFVSEQRLNALITAIKAKRILQQLPQTDVEVESQVDDVLRWVVYGAVEFNRLVGSGNNVNTVSFSPDGKTIATGTADRAINFWQRDGKLLKTLKAHQDEIYFLSYSPDGKLLASASGDNTIKLWEQDGKLVRTLAGHKATVWFLAWSRDGKFLASASQDKTVKLWSRDGRLLNTISGHDGAVYGVAISPHGNRIVSASTDGTAKVWQPDGRWIATLKGHRGAVWAVAFSPDGESIATSGQDKTVRLWQFQESEGTEIRPYKTLTGHEAAIWGLAFSRDGQFLVSTSVDKTARVWSREGRWLRTLKGHQGNVWGVAISPDNTTIATVSWDQTTRLWRLHHPLQHWFRYADDSIMAVKFSPDGQSLASSCLDGAIQLWGADGRFIKTIGRHSTEVWGLDFSPDGKWIASASADNTVKLWSREGKLLHTLKGHNDAVYAVDISPDSQTIASGSLDGTVKLWTRDGRLLRTFEEQTPEIETISFSPDSKTLVVFDHSPQIKIFGLDDRLHRTIDVGVGVILHSISLSPDGKIIATADNRRRIQLWDSRSGRLIRAWSRKEGSGSFLSTIKFSPDGQTLAMTAWDERLKLWNIILWNLKGKRLATLVAQQAEVRAIDFSPDGKTLVSGSFDRTLIAWNLESIRHLDPLSFACNWVRDYLHSNAEVEEGDRSLCDD
jgi:WD40 repeat protein